MSSRTLFPSEFKVVCLRDALPLPEQACCEEPAQAVDYWRLNVAASDFFRPQVECLVILCLNTRRRIQGHHVVTNGSIDTMVVVPAQVFQVPILAQSAAVILMHNHPSGDPTPSEADIRVTRSLVQAGRLLHIQVLDHIIIGNPSFRSLKECGYIDGGAQ